MMVELKFIIIIIIIIIIIKPWSTYQRWIRVRTGESLLAAFDRHLKERDYKYSTVRDREFYPSKLVL